MAGEEIDIHVTLDGEKIAQAVQSQMDQTIRTSPILSEKEREVLLRMAYDQLERESEPVEESAPARDGIDLFIEEIREIVKEEIARAEPRLVQRMLEKLVQRTQVSAGVRHDH